MSKFSIKSGLSAIVLSVIATSAFAERMSGQDVVTLFSKGPVEFRAGSIWTTFPANHYTFTHGKKKEEGTFKVFGKGDVHILDKTSGRTIRFYFDQSAKGEIALIYLNGGSKGRRFPVK